MKRNKTSNAEVTIAQQRRIQNATDRRDAAKGSNRREKKAVQAGPYQRHHPASDGRPDGLSVCVPRLRRNYQTRLPISRIS
jgi:hypothetical protein